MKHGFSGTNLNRHPLYVIWGNMIQRCTNPKNTNYAKYGAKGISVCSNWRDASIFLEWAEASGWEEGLMLDRIYGNLGYFPENCRWVSRKVQNLNRSPIHWVTMNGKTLCAKDWCREIGINYATFQFRLRKGMDIVEALTRPVRARNKE